MLNQKVDGSKITHENNNAFQQAKNEVKLKDIPRGLRKRIIGNINSIEQETHVHGIMLASESDNAATEGENEDRA